MRDLELPKPPRQLVALVDSDKGEMLIFLNAAVLKVSIYFISAYYKRY